MRHNPCAEFANNATRFMACENGMAGQWWMGFAALGVLIGALGVGVLAYYCYSRGQERGRAADTAASGLLSTSGRFAARASSDDLSDDAHRVIIAPPGGAN